MSTKYPTKSADEDLEVSRTGESTLAVALPETDAPTNPNEYVGPTCEHCGAPLKSAAVTICRSCGWYASLGRCVEVDPDWDSNDDDNVGSVPAQHRSHLGVWLNLLPRWAWFIIASVAAVVIESIVVRLMTPSGIGGLRTNWSLTQLFLGVFVFVGCHLVNFMMQIAADTEVGLLDLLMRPVRLWMRTAHLLPTRLWLVNSAVCGMTAAAMSLLVIGALPYDRLWDWGFKQPVKNSLMGAVMDRAKKLDNRDGADSLEDAVEDFAGSQGLEPDDESAKPAAPRETADCVILGFQVDRAGRLDSLVLATSYNTNLVFAGKVNPQISETERTELLQKLRRIQARQPFIVIQSDTAMWVQPKYACRVTYTERMPGGLLRDVQWETMLGTLRGQ